GLNLCSREGAVVKGRLVNQTGELTGGASRHRAAHGSADAQIGRSGIDGAAEGCLPAQNAVEVNSQRAAVVSSGQVGPAATRKRAADDGYRLKSAAVSAYAVRADGEDGIVASDWIIGDAEAEAALVPESHAVPSGHDGPGATYVVQPGFDSHCRGGAQGGRVGNANMRVRRAQVEGLTDQPGGITRAVIKH